MTETIEVTPTWRGILPMLLAAHDSGSFAAVKEAERELRRMADLADLYVALAKSDDGGEFLRVWITSQKVTDAREGETA